MNLSSFFKSTSAFFTRLWRGFLSFSRRTQIILVVIVLIIVGGLAVWARSGSNASTATAEPTVTLQSVDSFGDNSNGVDVLGTVQSVSEADLLAQSGGTVEAVNTKLGASVPAGFVIASLDSAAASASVLQAQGAYDAALAAEKATSLQSQNSTVSLATAQTSVRTGYQSAYVSLGSVLSNDVSALFGPETPVGPQLLINPLTTNDMFPRERASIAVLMNNWQTSLATANTADPLTLLANEQSNLTTVSTFLSDLATLASTQGSGATTIQLASLAAAQSTVSGLLASVTTAQTSYNASVTAAAVGQTQSGASNTGVTSSQASVEVALGGLRAAQAAYEKTIVRAPIAGTINYLPITVGDFVTPNQHVATVAQNNALEVLMELSQNDADRLAVGDTVTIEGTYKGIVTTISPALNPTTAQIEVDVAVNNGADLVNGQSVQVALPALPTSSAAALATTTSGTTASTTPNIEVPLTAVKLLPNERDIFTVDSTGHLVAHPVQIGQVIGDLIQITSPLASNLEIVTDARGLSAGDAVMIASSTAISASATATSSQ